MNVDHDPKVLEQQNISEKNLFDEFKQQASSNNFINHEALEEPIVADNNLFQEEDQQFSSKNLHVQQEETNVGGNNFFQEEDQQFSAKKLDAQLEMEERFAVDTLCSLIDFDFPKELDVNPTIAVNSLRVLLERDHKVSRSYLHDVSSLKSFPWNGSWLV
nr:hypothetical protein [Tanacetum cinerariifolium]